MSAIFRFFRKMNVILFLSFLLFSAFFVVIIVVMDNQNWNQMFSSFESKDLDRSAYLLMDDMKREQIADSLTPEQEEWLRRRAALYGVLILYESKDHKEIWLNTYAKARRKVDEGTFSSQNYINNGVVLGNLRLGQMSMRDELNPAFQAFTETVQQRTRILLICVVFVAIIISLVVARKLSEHLKLVYTIAVQISEGKRNLKIPIKGPEEVRKLAITLTEMTAELKRQEDWRHHLMEDFMHELRTPLTSILSQVEAIVDGIYEPETERMEEIYDELVRLSRLVNDLERLSEAEAARFTMNVKRTDMVKLARSIYNNHKALAREKRITFQFEPTNVPCYSEVDADKIRQVLTNVVLNAIKYTSAPGQITIRVDWWEDQTILSCEDTGIGINSNDLPYIFNRLYRVDKSRSRFSGGVGLGLSIAKALVEAHNGRIEADSHTEKGSKFTITIPNQYLAYGDS